ncbi:SOS response-associated peptidase [Polycyclovorans algicola]|uniref:SOS response-associated peptidase n=1 Tax=Polycyclovorans algicola TaxID=616992 RepID=UPI0005BB38AE|nr:SOS response-associated peptidase family protein [Polycyclovorans algicola]
MCANFQPPPLEKLLAWGFAIAEDAQYKAEVFPGQVAPIVTSADPYRIHMACFGLVPHWAEPKLARMTYNARSETVASKPSFRAAWRNGQLGAIPVQSFFEPSYESGKAVRHAIRRKDREPFWLAGLWERRLDDPGPTRMSFTLLTISAEGHSIMGRMHEPEDQKRSVVLLDGDERNEWLNAKASDRHHFMRLFEESDFEDQAEPSEPRQSARKVSGH